MSETVPSAAVASEGETVAALAGEIEFLRQRLAEEHQTNIRMRARLRETESELTKFRRLASTRSRELTRLHSSTSWRLTAPVRILKEHGRSILRFLPARLSRRVVEAVRNSSWGANPVAETKRRMLTLGFAERGLADLTILAERGRSPRIRTEAAWELAALYIDRGGVDNARLALPFIDAVSADPPDADAPRKLAIMLSQVRQALGEEAAARRTLLDALLEAAHPDLFLALTALDADSETKVARINEALDTYGLEPVSLRGDASVTPYDRLAADLHGGVRESSGPLVSVIMPAFDAAPFIGTAIRSIQAQTHRDFELLVVDDCSTDDTRAAVERFAAGDNRIRLLSTPFNAGPYVARNVALGVASGVFVTCNDSDDWSHPRKLETQVRHLQANPGLAGNFSEQARVSPDLTFYRRAKPGQFVFRNMSSFMFRREIVLAKLGFWDSVRFGADNEFIKRVTAVFGENSIAIVPALLSFQRQTEGSLTGNSKFGYHGYFAGARKEYLDRHREHHESGADLRYDFPLKERPFPIPEPMRPRRRSRAGGRRHFDVILASEFRFKGGSNLSNIEEIKAMKAAGLHVGLVQMSRYDLRMNQPTNPLVVAELDGERCEMLVYGEEVSCDLLVVRYPPALQDRQRWIPDVEAKAVRVIVNQPPMSDYGSRAELRYTIASCAANLRDYFGRDDAVWHPIGPAIRRILHEHHAAELSAIDLSPVDWVNIIDPEMWRRPGRPAPGPRPRIGRHSRDHEMKWPADRETLLRIYPDDERYAVRAMGGAQAPARVLGRLPSNWEVLDFDAVPVQEFLAGLDVFVYYTNPAWVEAFGRVVIEAMAVGVPVILPPSYEALFGAAALYAEPEGVLPLVDRLMADPGFYEERVRTAFDYVERRFGYAMHVARVRSIIEPSAAAPAGS